MHYFWVTADHDRSIETGENALATARDSEHSDLELASRYLLGLAYHGKGQYSRAIDHLSAAIASTEPDRFRRPLGFPNLPSVVTRMFLVWCLAERGDFVEGMERAEEAVRIAEADGRPGSLIHAYLGIGMFQLRRGEGPLAISWLKRALQVSEIANLPFYGPWIACSLGYAHTLSYQADEALTVLNAGVNHAISMNVMAYHPLWLAYLSEANMLLERLDDAQELAERAVRLSREQRADGSQAWALRMVAAVAAQREPSDTENSAKHYREAMSLATELGMRPLVAHCHLGLGKLYRRTGQRDQAHEHLTTATTLYREMEMQFWLEQAEAEVRERWFPLIFLIGRAAMAMTMTIERVMAFMGLDVMVAKGEGLFAAEGLDLRIAALPPDHGSAGRGAPWGPRLRWSDREI